jgi:hypothetical protein
VIAQAEQQRTRVLKHQETAMETGHFVTYGCIGTITAIIAAKWAMELGARQWRQLLWMVASVLVPPLVLLALYVRLVRQSKAEGKPGGRW